MEKFFTTCLLVQDEVSGTKLVHTQINLPPHQRVSFDQGTAVLLAGGFTSLTPEAECPLSSTLFVNSSLTSHDQQTLHRIASAELRRFSDVEYRSYTLEPDNRVAVLSNNVDKLLTFIDNYGGVLQIEPLLLRGCHPELPSVSELTLIPLSQGCRLEYQVRTPIDTRRCNYCGSCGPACPEHCIDEKLFLDYARCTLCRMCEPVCPTGAIDVHAAQAHTLEVGAIILLDDVQLGDGATYIYREDELPRYFSTLFPIQLDEVVTWNESLCQYSTRRGYGCNLCSTICSFGALTRDSKGVHIDSYGCEECGACVAVCPTGAIQYERCNDRTFATFLQNFPSLMGATVVIGTEQALHRLWWQGQYRNYEQTFFIEFANPQALTLYHYLTLAALGAKQVVVLCETAVASEPEQLLLANIFIKKLYEIDQYCSCLDVHTIALEGLPKAAPLPVEPLAELKFSNRREGVAAALNHLVQQSGRQVELQAQGNLPFASISCDSDRCTQCGACLNDCRIGALSADAGELTLHHTAALCVACSLCVRTCPENALALSPRFTLGDDFFAAVELARAEPMICQRCGKVFGTKKSYQRVMAILASKETVDVSHFAYCETCRVLNIFEDQ